jgi:aspartyl-tRNA(Asn)/glutamyl-tRNA(Gln) amidotransferase subunit A
VKDYSTLAEIQGDIRIGSASCTALVEQYLSRIAASEALNAFIEVYADEAREAAARVDEKLANGTAGRLAGLVIGLKDVLCHEGHVLTASSRILGSFQSLITATAVRRLLDEDAIVIGRLSCDEFAMGSSNENACYGPVRNPVDTTCVPGGSSGGSAVAVRAGLCHAALGSDTGGSVRQPASFVGTVGFKPSYGRVSRWGLIAYASSFDQIGPITKSVEDAAWLMQIMAGHDPHDNTSSHQEVPDYTGLLNADPDRKYTIGYLREVLDSEGLDPEIRVRTYELLDELKAAGHTVRELHFPYLDFVVPCYYILTTAEASSNLSRFDGIRYGYRSEGVTDLESVYKRSRTEGFGAEVRRRILLGTFVLSAGFYDAYYTRAMQVRRLIRDITLEMLGTCDFILTPTAPTTAFRLGEKSDDPVEMYLSDIYTVHANLAGVPAVSLPLGEHSKGMPFGIQLMARHFEEDRLLAFSRYLMQGRKVEVVD